jgi:kumamolisin
MDHLGPVPADQRLTLTVALRPRSATQLHDAVTVHQRSSHPQDPPLSPLAFGQAYGRPQSDVDTLTQYFHTYGLVSTPPLADYLSFQVRGTASQIERALGVNLNNYADSHGERFYATDGDPHLPANLAVFVQAVFGLDNYPSFHPQYTKVSSSE